MSGRKRPLIVRKEIDVREELKSFFSAALQPISIHLNAAYIYPRHVEMSAEVIPFLNVYSH